MPQFAEITRGYTGASEALQAVANLGRAVGRAQVSPVAALVRSALRNEQIAALGWADGELLDIAQEERKYGRTSAGIGHWDVDFAELFGRLDALDRSLDAEAVIEWLRFRRKDASDGPFGILALESEERARPRIEAWSADLAKVGRQPRPIRALVACGAWLTLSPLLRGNRSVALMIGDRLLFDSDVSYGGLLAIGMRSIDRPPLLWVRSGDRLGPDWWRAVSAAAARLEAKELEVRRFMERAETLAAGLRNREVVLGVCRLLMHESSVTPALVARRLRISVAAAHRGIDWMERAALVRDTTQQRSWREFRAVH